MYSCRDAVRGQPEQVHTMKFSNACLVTEAQPRVSGPQCKPEDKGSSSSAKTGFRLPIVAVHARFCDISRSRPSRLFMLASPATQKENPVNPKKLGKKTLSLLFILFLFS